MSDDREPPSEGNDFDESSAEGQLEFGGGLSRPDRMRAYHQANPGLSYDRLIEDGFTKLHLYTDQEMRGLARGGSYNEWRKALRIQVGGLSLTFSVGKGVHAVPWRRDQMTFDMYDEVALAEAKDGLAGLRNSSKLCREAKQRFGKDLAVMRHPDLGPLVEAAVGVYERCFTPDEDEGDDD